MSHDRPPGTAWARAVGTPLRAFVATETSGAIAILAAALTALVWANSPWAGSYEELWTTDGTPSGTPLRSLNLSNVDG